jgi:hypothetical protein
MSLKFTKKCHSCEVLLHQFFPQLHEDRIHNALCEILDSSLQPQGIRNTVRRLTTERNTPTWLRWFCSQIDFLLWGCLDIYHSKKGLNTPDTGHDVNIALTVIQIIVIYILLPRLTKKILIDQVIQLYVNNRDLSLTF